MSLRGCICRREEVAVKPDCIVVITQTLSPSNSTFTDSPFYHPSNIPLCAALLLSNPHSRSLRAAPRFSPTRFIPPLRLPEYFGALLPPGFGDKTLYVRPYKRVRRRISRCLVALWRSPRKQNTVLTRS